MKKVIDGKRICFSLLVLVFSMIESILILSHPQFGNNIGEYQFRSIRWDEEKDAYCYTYQNQNYRTIWIYSETKDNADSYKVVLESMEEIIVNQSENIIFVPDRGGITDFDHYKKVFDKKSNKIINKILDNKTENLLPQNILSIIFILILNSGFSSMILFTEKVIKYKSVFLTSKDKQKKVSLFRERGYKIIGLGCMIILLIACLFR